MKPETFRLLSLDLIVAIACALQIFKDYSAHYFAPVLLAQLTVLGYGAYLLCRKVRDSHSTS